MNPMMEGSITNQLMLEVEFPPVACIKNKPNEVHLAMKFAFGVKTHIDHNPTDVVPNSIQD